MKDFFAQFTCCMWICVGVLLGLLFLLTGVPTFLHECGHCIAIIKFKKSNSDFKEPLMLYITVWLWIRVFKKKHYAKIVQEWQKALDSQANIGSGDIEKKEPRLLEGRTDSNFQEYLAQNVGRYKCEIKKVARAGFLYTVVFYSVCLVVGLSLAVSTACPIFWLLTGFSILSLFVAGITHFTTTHELSDRNIAQNPEIFRRYKKLTVGFRLKFR